MQIYNAEFEIDLLEFCDRFGNIRSTSGCSFQGKVEFDARMKILADLLKQYEGETIGTIYYQDKNFKHNCDRCLKLNGINPKWLTEVHLTELLFIHNKKAGALVLLNRASNPSDKALGSRDKALEGNLYHQFLGAMYNFSKDPEQAFRLAKDYPYKDVAGMIQEVSNKDRSAQQRDYTSRTKFGVSRAQVASSKLERKRSPSPTGRREISDRSRLELMALREKTKN